MTTTEGFAAHVAGTIDGASVARDVRRAMDSGQRTAWPATKMEGKQTMPFVNVKVIEGVFTPTQKQDIVRRVTDAMVAVEGEIMRPVTWLVVEEVASGDWGIAGTPMHAADVKALAAGQPVA
jgi:4-oxalocrotonate tautomerase